MFREGGECSFPQGRRLTRGSTGNPTAGFAGRGLPVTRNVSQPRLTNPNANFESPSSASAETKFVVLRVAPGLGFAPHCMQLARFVAKGTSKAPSRSARPQLPQACAGRPSVGGRRTSAASGRGEYPPNTHKAPAHETGAPRCYGCLPSGAGLIVFAVPSGSARALSHKRASSVPQGIPMQFAVGPLANPSLNRTVHSRLRRPCPAGYLER